MLVKIYTKENLYEVTEISSFRLIENGIELIQHEKECPIGSTIFRRLMSDGALNYFDGETHEWFSRFEIESKGKIIYQSDPPPPKSESFDVPVIQNTIFQ